MVTKTGSKHKERLAVGWRRASASRLSGLGGSRRGNHLQRGPPRRRLGKKKKGVVLEVKSRTGVLTALGVLDMDARMRKGEQGYVKVSCIL